MERMLPPPAAPLTQWVQGARKFDLIPGYVMCAEQAAEVAGAGRWEPFARGRVVSSRRHARG